MANSTKRIIVLANSIKNGARCVAGVQWPVPRVDLSVDAVDPDLTRNQWIRPITAAGDGELPPECMQLEHGGPILIGDVIDVPLLQQANDPVHPEDWLVDAARLWRRVGTMNSLTVLDLEEHPEDLWLLSKLHSDRAPAAFFLNKQKHQSIFLIRPVDFHVELSVVLNQFKKKNQKKYRAKFEYRGMSYDLGLTDPMFTKKYCQVFPAVGEKPLVVRPPSCSRALITVSLTPKFNDYHYKVVAAVVELP